MNPSIDEHEAPPAVLIPAPLSPTRLARTVLSWFLLTFVAARVLVLLIMLHRVPDMYFFIGNTHVHHLNYGIFLIAIVGAILLLARPLQRGKLKLCAAAYGAGMALTFDEYGMWLHLGGSYWQRESFDAVIIVGTIFFLIAAAPRLGRMRPRHWFTAAILSVALAVFVGLLAYTFHRLGQRFGPSLRQIEQTGPPL